MTEGLHRCEHCGYAVLTKYDDGAIKLRSEIVIWRDDRCTIICRSCKKEVEVEIPLPKTYLKQHKVTYFVVDKDRRFARRKRVDLEALGEKIDSK